MSFSNDDINNNYLQNISLSNGSLDKNKYKREGPHSGEETHNVSFLDCRTEKFTFGKSALISHFRGLSIWVSIPKKIKLSKTSKENTPCP